MSTSSAGGSISLSSHAAERDQRRQRQAQRARRGQDSQRTSGVSLRGCGCRLRRRGRNFAADVLQLQLDESGDRPGPWIQQPAPRHIRPAHPAHRPSQPARRRGSRAPARRTRRPSRRPAVATPRRACPLDQQARQAQPRDLRQLLVLRRVDDLPQRLMASSKRPHRRRAWQAAGGPAACRRTSRGRRQDRSAAGRPARRRCSSALSAEVRIHLRGLRPAASRYVCQYCQPASSPSPSTTPPRIQLQFSRHQLRSASS